MSEITTVFETFLSLKDSIADSSSLRSRIRSSSGARSVEAVALEFDPEEGPEIWFVG